MLGNDKKDITKLEELYRDMSAEIYLEKVHTDLLIISLYNIALNNDYTEMKT